MDENVVPQNILNTLDICMYIEYFWGVLKWGPHVCKNQKIGSTSVPSNRGESLRGSENYPACHRNDWPNGSSGGQRGY